MKRIGWLAVFLMAALPGWAAKKMTVDQLKAYLISAKQAGTSDHDVAKELEGVELTEELTQTELQSLGQYVPGQMTTERLFIIEVQSSVLPPPASDIPTSPVPDAAAQKAILDKATDYASKTYAQMPAVNATKETRRFQDNAEMPQQSIAARNNATFSPTITPIHYTAADSGQVTFHNGVEGMPAQAKGSWGQNGMIAMLGQTPALSTVLDEAQQTGKIAFVRWETVNGHQVAVFTYAVDKKKTKYEVAYCCFADTGQAGNVALRGTETGGGSGNYQTQEDWKVWKSKVGYHGEIFIDPTTGVVMRLITIADLKGSDPVRLETQRIDYGEQTVGGKAVVVPVRDVIDTTIQPYPDDPAGRMIFRHTLFTEEYKDYQAAS